MKLCLSKPTTSRFGGLLLSFALASAGAQTPDPAAMPSTHAPASTPAAAADTTQMQQELAKLREQVRLLEQRVRPTAGGAAIAQNRPAPAKPGMKKMGMGMEMEDDMDMPMGDPPPDASMPAPSGGMGMEMDMMKRMDKMRPKMSDDGMMGMGAMGGMNSPAAMATPSALPGFPGQSHLYHIGATGFFLDHPEHITLTTQQKQALAQRKQQSLLKQGEVQRQIDAAEQEMWQLTGADQPQIAEVEKKAREIERLRADQRITFVRAVGEAAKVLTDQQRKQLTGTAPAQSTADPAPMSMPDKNPPKTDKMGHM